jgi:hypothetical protein
MYNCNHINQATNYQTDHYNVNYILKPTDPLSVEYILTNVFLLEDGRTTETCSNQLSNRSP